MNKRGEDVANSAQKYLVHWMLSCGTRVRPRLAEHHRACDRRERGHGDLVGNIVGYAASVTLVEGPTSEILNIDFGSTKKISSHMHAPGSRRFGPV